MKEEYSYLAPLHSPDCIFGAPITAVVLPQEKERANQENKLLKKQI